MMSEHFMKKKLIGLAQLLLIVTLPTSRQFHLGLTYYYVAMICAYAVASHFVLTNKFGAIAFIFQFIQQF